MYSTLFIFCTVTGTKCAKGGRAEGEICGLLNKLTNNESHLEEIGEYITDKYETNFFFDSDREMLKNIVLKKKKNEVNEKKRKTME